MLQSCRGGGIMLFPQFIPTTALSRLKMNERSTSAARFIKTTRLDRAIDILFMLFFSKQSDLIENTTFFVISSRIREAVLFA